MGHINYHSKREDRALYPMGDRLLDARTEAKLLAQFGEREKENESMISFFKQVIETYEKMPGF
jgi:hypothetical protein